MAEHGADMRSDYSTAIEGDRRVSRRFAIAGRLDVAEYLAFVVERANWFGIDGWVAAEDARRVTLVAAGPEAMVGALEMACTLGPLSALVEEISRSDERAPVARGFAARQK